MNQDQAIQIMVRLQTAISALKEAKSEADKSFNAPEVKIAMALQFAREAYKACDEVAYGERTRLLL
jgi:hypothetical protein